MEVLGDAYRVFIIILGFTAMWALFRAKSLRGHTWTGKMRDIWTCLTLFAFCTIPANIELLFRHQRPTFALIIVGYALVRTIRGCLKTESYTKT